ASTTRMHGGLGLGLSIVRHLVEAHGGTVHAESAGEGLGSAFIVRLPVGPALLDQPEPLESRPAVPASDPLGGTPPPARDGAVALVVDDEEDAREVVAACLEEAGAEVAKAASADEALAVLQDRPIHVLLADIAMPDVDGYTLIRNIRAQRHHEM